MYEYIYLFRETLNAHIRNDLGRDPDAMWDTMYETIVATYQVKILIEVTPYLINCLDLILWESA